LDLELDLAAARKQRKKSGKASKKPKKAAETIDNSNSSSSSSDKDNDDEEIAYAAGESYSRDLVARYHVPKDNADRGDDSRLPEK